MSHTTYQQPPLRQLRCYAFDPSLSISLDTVDVNLITYTVPWEELEEREMPAGSEGNKKERMVSIPTGEYVEIIDYDPASEAFYLPVDLDDPYLLAQDGLPPSVSNPQFHQQMVYAVVMTTIKNFEAALGRRIQWAEHIGAKQEHTKPGQKGTDFSFVKRLRIYPHALRQANAYYDPQKQALLFGYFPATPANSQLHLPGGTVFTCLSHDIIAHETTHAILDGLHRRFSEPSNPDTRAFHEAFADIIALFQHFTFPEVLKHQIRKTRGDLTSQNMLGQLASEFGHARGGNSVLRDAIGQVDENGVWQPHVPKPGDYQSRLGFHERGSILVAAVFDAFLNIYKSRIMRFLRMSTGGTGKLSDGELMPDLVDQLAETASKVAGHILHMCVRAIDYCPPVDITFGDYLRALITADRDLVADDEHDYRVAFIEAFHRRGIFPRNIKSMSEAALCHKEISKGAIPDVVRERLIDFLIKFKNHVSYLQDREKIHNITKAFISGKPNHSAGIEAAELQNGLHQLFSRKFFGTKLERQQFSALTGLLFPDGQEECRRMGFDVSSSGSAKYEIGQLWLSNRTGPKGQLVNQVVVTVLQKRGVLPTLDRNGTFSTEYCLPQKTEQRREALLFRGGATLIFDLDTRCLKYVISKSMDDPVRMELQYRFANNLMEGASVSTYFTEAALSAFAGPFAFMHSHSHTV